MPEITQATRKLISSYQLWRKSLQSKDGANFIHVDEAVSGVAVFYEKMRGVVDWREEHLLKKTAVERILKRRLFFKKDGNGISGPMIHELIRGGYFLNDTIPESRITEIQKAIDKYVYIWSKAPLPAHEKIRPQIFDKLLSIAACEIEEILTPAIREAAIMDFMLELMKERMEVKERQGAIVSRLMPEDEKNTQIYIAAQKALFKLDASLIYYNLLKKWFPDWADLPQEKLEEIAKNISSILEKLEKNLRHPLAEKFYSICERYDTAYLILDDVMSKTEPEELENILKKPEIFEAQIKSAYKERLKKVKGRLRRAAFYGTVSIFLSKVLVAFAIEAPFDKYITGEFNYQTAGLSILIPPLLMAFLISTIKPPSKQNEQLVVMEVMKIAYQKERKDAYIIRPTAKRGFVSNIIMALIYFLSFVGSFGFIILGLRKLNFSLISIAIFVMFTSLISFAGVKIRQRAQELKVEKDKETLLRTFIDLFSLPIIQMGKWLSSQWQRYNAVAVLFNSLLDMPFQVFIEFLEQWRSFLREKREEIH